MARLSARTGVVISLWTLCLFMLYSYYPSQTYSGITRVNGNSSDPITVDRLSHKLEYISGQLLEKKYEVGRLTDKVLQLEVVREQEQEQQRDQQRPSSASREGKEVAPPAPINTQNLTQVSLDVPNLFQLMPHLHNDVRALYPRRSVGHTKHGVEMVLAVPHVHRDKEDYLIRTLSSLYQQMSAEDKAKTVIVVMVAEPFNEAEYDKVVKEISAQFAKELNAGCLEVILPPAKWYPDLDSLPEKWGDKPDRAKWRTKQNLDYAFMMLYCSHIGRLYVQLEDDISAKPDYIGQMKKYASSQDRWELLEFSQLGFIGKMFKSEMLPKFVSFILMFYKHKPVDWLLDNYFWVQECQGKSCPDLSKIRKRFRPSLFQHEGYHSSLAGKVQKLKDKDFNKKGQKVKDPVIYAHTNPDAVVETSLKVYQQFTLDKCYQGKSVFWALNPQPNDHITITFKQPQTIKSYKVVSGDSQHVDDRLQNATIEFMPVDKNAAHPKNSFIIDSSGFVAVQYFNTTARREADDEVAYSIAAGSVPSELGAVSAVRILSHSESQNWMIISELWFVT